MVSIHLAQDENDCLGAWVSAKEAGLISEEEQDQKVNYGRLLLQALFEEWKRLSTTEEATSPGATAQAAEGGALVGGALVGGTVNGFFSVPLHTPVDIGEQGGKTMYRFLVRDAGGEAERSVLFLMH